MRKILFLLLAICMAMTGCIVIYTDKPSQNDNKTVNLPAGNTDGADNNQTLPFQPQSEQSVTLNLVATESGSLVKNAATYMKSSMPCVGDTDANFPSRAFLSFDISSLPKSAVVKEASLNLSSYSVIGSPTYNKSNWGNMGALEFYQLQYGLSGDIGRVDYESIVPLVSAVKLTNITGLPLTIDVTQDNSGNNFIQQLLAKGSARCQFRAQFFTSTNWDSKADLICLDGMVLKITYSMP